MEGEWKLIIRGKKKKKAMPTWKDMRQVYIYAHHGIYVGEEKVIHFTRGGDKETGTGTFLDLITFESSFPSHSGTPCPNCGDQSSLHGVICSCLGCFLDGGELYRFEYGVSTALFLAKVRGGTCTLATVDPLEHTLHRAKYLLENGFGVYNVFKNNCEDFAIYCKTGLLVESTALSVGGSGQAVSVYSAADAAGAVVSSPLGFLTTSVPGLAAVGYGMYCARRLSSDIGMRRDVRKVQVEGLVAGYGEASDAAAEAAKFNGSVPDDLFNKAS